MRTGRKWRRRGMLLVKMIEWAVVGPSIEL